MPRPVLDFHTHAQNIFGTCCVPRPLRRLVRNGPGRIFEKSGFDARLVRGNSKLLLDLTVCEMQARFATFTFDDYRAAMKKNGVAFACALPIEPMGTTRELVAMTKAHPEVIPFASIDFGSGEEPTKQLDRHLDAGCRGLKLHPIMQDVSPDDPRVVGVFERLRGTGVPVLFHTGAMKYHFGKDEHPESADPSRLVSLLKRFPEQPIVLGHMGLLHGADEAIRVAKQFENAYLEVSFQPATSIARALGEIGPSRILLGSDWPASDAPSEVRQIEKATSGDRAAMDAILFDNGAELLRRAGATLS
jgi:predicted TIM-barrel fold metal-dependent hydrolase